MSAKMKWDRKYEILANITDRDESGRHFTEVYSDRELAVLEDAGLIEIDRPVHEQTGIPYSREYWSLEVTEAGRCLVYYV